MPKFDTARRKVKNVAGRRIAVAVLVSVVCGALMMMACKHGAHGATETGKAGAQQVKGVLHLESFVVNLADPEDNRFLRIGIDLGLKNPMAAKEGKSAEGEVPNARIRDCILAVLSTWQSDALLAPEGKQKLKDELVHALRDRVPELGVQEVYFTDFLVQR